MVKKKKKRWVKILTGLPARLAVSTVTHLLTAVKTTVELVATDNGAFMLRVLI